jgi:hypothetical protein
LPDLGRLKVVDGLALDKTLHGQRSTNAAVAP